MQRVVPHRTDRVRIRLLDAGQVPAVRSQTLYHAVAECAAPTDAPTLCIVHPDRPYVSIGFHQEAAREIDLAYCREHGLPVIRRRVGGGAVLLDANQLFFHLVVPRKRLDDLGLPRRFEERYARLVAPAIAAYRTLGVAAELRPPNDIQVGGRKIGGTGTADIEDSFVFVGSMMLRFDHALMAHVLRFGDQALRDEVRKSIAAGVTSLEAELGAAPNMAVVHAALLDGFRRELGVDLGPGRLSEVENRKAAELEELFQSEAWLHRLAWSRERPRRLMINGAVGYLEAETPNGGHVAIRVVDGRVDQVLVARHWAAADEIEAVTRKLIAAAAA